MVSMRRISLERRQGNNEDADALFQDYIENAKKPEIGSFFSIKFARYLFKVIIFRTHLLAKFSMESI